MRPNRPQAGARVLLDAVDPAQAEGPYLSWLLDAEVTRFLEARFTQYDAVHLRDYIVRENGRDDAVLFGIYLADARRLIGTLKLSQIRRDHRHCDLGLMIGDKTVWGRGLGAETIRLGTDYAFRVLDMHRVLAGIYSNNLASERAFLRAGYEHEGRLRDDRWDGQGWVDKLLLGKINRSEKTHDIVDRTS
ncbi:MAG TPA: GNAT family protein [Burkholderiales bacterium]|nr:GNAT family protein [Burkholderiales bacterium]